MIATSKQGKPRGKSAQVKRSEWIGKVEKQGGGKNIRSIVEHNLLKSIKTEKATSYGGSVAIVPPKQNIQPLTLINTEEDIETVRQTSRKRRSRCFIALMSHPVWDSLNKEDKQNAHDTLKAYISDLHEQDCRYRIIGYVENTDVLQDANWQYAPKSIPLKRQRPKENALVATVRKALKQVQKDLISNDGQAESALKEALLKYLDSKDMDQAEEDTDDGSTNVEVEDSLFAGWNSGKRRRLLGQDTPSTLMQAIMESDGEEVAGEEALEEEGVVVDE
ncbi:MAG: hypothetical protein Q9187_009365 [Circinaria calcarea]